MNNEEKLSKQAVLQRIENAELANMETNPSNCGGFVIGVMTGNTEKNCDANSRVMNEFLNSRQEIGIRTGYDVKLAQAAHFIAIGHQMGERMVHMHYAVIDPSDPAKIFHRSQYLANVSHGEASELLAPFLEYVRRAEKGNIHSSVIYYK